MNQNTRRGRIAIGVASAFAALGLASATPAIASPYDTLQTIAGKYNVFLLGDLGSSGSPYNADSQGAMAIAGNAYLNNVGVDTSGSGPAALQVGGTLNATGGTITGNTFVGASANLSSSSVNGSISTGGNLTDSGGTTGNIYVGGASANLTNSVTVNGSISLTGSTTALNAANNSGQSPTAIYTASANNIVSDPNWWAKPTIGAQNITPPLDLFGTSTDLLNASTGLATLAGTVVTSSGGAITITLTQSGMNVVNLSLPNGANINGINIVTAPGVSATGLVVNVSGDNLNFNGGSFALGTLNNNQVLFNFDNAKTLTLQNLGFEGALLAPLATVNFSSGHIDGALIANTYLGPGQFNQISGFSDPVASYANANAQVASVTPVATPEPGTLFVFGTGLLALHLVRRRKAASDAGL